MALLPAELSMNHDGQCSRALNSQLHNSKAWIQMQQRTFTGIAFIFLKWYCYKNMRLHFNRLFFLFSFLIYPGFITFLIASLTFPPGFGQFMAGEVRVGCAFWSISNSVEQSPLLLFPNNLTSWEGEERFGRVWSKGLYCEMWSLISLSHKTWKSFTFLSK